MIWAAFFLSAVAWMFQRGAYVDADLASALWCWAGAALLFAAARWRRHGRLDKRLLWSPQALFALICLPLVCASSQWLFLLAYDRLSMAGADIPGIALAVVAGLRLLGIETHAAPALVYAQTEFGTVSIRATLDVLAVPLIGSAIAPAVLLKAGELTREPAPAAAWLAKVLAIAAGYCLLRFAIAFALHLDHEVVGVFWDPRALALQTAPLALLLAALAPLQSGLAHHRAISRRDVVFAAAVFLATALVAVLATLRLPSANGPARVLIDDAHSNWAWASVPFEKASFTRQATYSYTNLVEFIGFHHTVRVNRDGALDDMDLSAVDVLILKTPTKAYTESEIDAVESFVSAGGGLFLIGDHTNLFGMTTNINPVAGRFGLRFLDDATYDLASGSPSRFSRSPLTTHPVAQHIDGLEFETSCTVRGPLWAEYALRGKGLARELVDYSHINFFGNMRYDLDDGFGVFAQGLSVRHGAGRVFAFTDSTVFSNFSVYKEGRAELALAAIGYLSGAGGVASIVVWAIAVLLLGAFAALARWRILRPSVALAVPAVAGGVLVSMLAVTAWHERAFALPAPSAPYQQVVFDKHFSRFDLPSMIGVRGSSRERSFDAFFVATQRLGLVPRLRGDVEAALAEADTFVVVNPAGTVYQRHALGVKRLLERGGNLVMVLDDRGPFYTANALLSEIGVRVRLPGGGGDERGAVVENMERVAVPERIEEGGERLPVIYAKRVGAGRALVVASGQYFSQEWMGPAFNNPDERQRRLYELEYFLFEGLLR